MPDPVDRAEKSTSVRVVSPAMGFRDFGAVTAFHGQAVTISCFENNPLVREALMDEKGEGRVLVVDGGGKLVHVEYVPEMTDHPDYDAALAAAKAAS